jgi:hypothetical protein
VLIGQRTRPGVAGALSEKDAASWLSLRAAAAIAAARGGIAWRCRVGFRRIDASTAIIWPLASR